MKLLAEHQGLKSYQILLISEPVSLYVKPFSLSDTLIIDDDSSESSIKPVLFLGVFDIFSCLLFGVLKSGIS